MLLTSLECRMGLRPVGSVTGVAPWVVARGALASAALVWWDWGLVSGFGARGQGEGYRSRIWCKGLGSGFEMWHLGPGPGLGSRVRVWALGSGSRVKDLGSRRRVKVGIWGPGSRAGIKIWVRVQGLWCRFGVWGPGSAV